MGLRVLKLAERKEAFRTDLLRVLGGWSTLDSVFLTAEVCVAVNSRVERWFFLVPIVVHGTLMLVEIASIVSLNAARTFPGCIGRHGRNAQK